jgi:hypothetical protein
MIRFRVTARFFFLKARLLKHSPLAGGDHCGSRYSLQPSPGRTGSLEQLVSHGMAESDIGKNVEH